MKKRAEWRAALRTEWRAAWRCQEVDRLTSGPVGQRCSVSKGNRRPDDWLGYLKKRAAWRAALRTEWRTE